jgi:hypothetical protein
MFINNSKLKIQAAKEQIFIHIRKYFIKKSILPCTTPPTLCKKLTYFA